MRLCLLWQFYIQPCFIAVLGTGYCQQHINAYSLLVRTSQFVSIPALHYLFTSGDEMTELSSEISGMHLSDVYAQTHCILLKGMMCSIVNEIVFWRAVCCNLQQFSSYMQPQHVKHEAGQCKVCRCIPDHTQSHFETGLASCLYVIVVQIKCHITVVSEELGQIWTYLGNYPLSPMFLHDCQHT